MFQGAVYYVLSVKYIIVITFHLNKRKLRIIIFFAIKKNVLHFYFVTYCTCNATECIKFPCVTAGFSRP